ncbi:MAG: sensor histidine kinase [Acidimicrobiia bacterium]
MTTLLAIVLSLLAGVLIGVRRERSRQQPILLPIEPVEETPVIPEVREALDSLTVGVVVASPEGEIVFRNGVARGLTGAVHSDVLVEEAIEVHLLGALDGQTRRQVLDLFGPPRKVVAVSATPLAAGGAVAMVEDITERSILDAVRTDFVANISHELKTPVGALAVLAEALSSEDDIEVIHRLSGKMVDEALRVGRTIDDLLELSRIELGGEAVKDAVSVGLVVAEAVDRARLLSERRAIEVVTVDASERMKVLGDRRQLVSAIGNLVENAVKYSERGSKVEVSARSDGTWVEFKVRDYGLGIPARDLDRIFERFYRVDRARSRETGGTGLGLAIVRHVATNHGGDVTVSSTEGEGSTFVFKVPAAPGLVMTTMSEVG